PGWKIIPPRLLTAWFRRSRGNPSGSQVMKGSFEAMWPAESAAAAAPGPAWTYGLFCLNRASPTGVIGGIGARETFWGPTQAPVRSCLGAGPGGLGILGTPSAT